LDVINLDVNHMINDTTATAQIIPFRRKELLLVDNGGEPFVPMKPVVDGMGLAWQPQHLKLSSGRFQSCVTEMVIQLPGDKQRRSVTCLPLRKLAGWLMSIHASKIRPDLRDNVIAYQNECDDALWAYWNDGIAVRRDNRSAASVLSTTIGTDGFHCLAAIVDGKVRHLPAPMRRGAKNHIWSQVHKAFSVVSVEDIPAAGIDSVRNFIASYVLDCEWLKREEVTGFGALIGRQLAPGERWMVYVDSHGVERYSPLAHDASAMSHRQLIEAMLKPGEIGVSTEEMFEFVAAGMQNLKMRADNQAHMLRALRPAL
jgi:hypothetical protein